MKEKEFILSFLILFPIFLGVILSFMLEILIIFRLLLFFEKNSFLNFVKKSLYPTSFKKLIQNLKNIKIQ